jgi:hypothetical protein
LLPGHARGQYAQGVTQVDHLVEPGTKEIFGGRAREHAQTPRNQLEYTNNLRDILPESDEISL